MLIVIFIWYFIRFLVDDANIILRQFCNDYHMKMKKLKFHEKQPKLIKFLFASKFAPLNMINEHTSEFMGEQFNIFMK